MRWEKRKRKTLFQFSYSISLFFPLFSISLRVSVFLFGHSLPLSPPPFSSLSLAVTTVLSISFYIFASTTHILIKPCQTPSGGSEGFLVCLCAYSWRPSAKAHRLRQNPRTTSLSSLGLSVKPFSLHSMLSVSLNFPFSISHSQTFLLLTSMKSLQFISRNV